MARNNPDSNIKTITEAVAEAVFDREYGSLKEENKSIKWLMGAVIIVLLVGFVTLFLMAQTLVIDSQHINSAAYDEYSSKINMRDDLIDSNKKLLEINKELMEINKQNQKTIQSLTEKVQ